MSLPPHTAFLALPFWRRAPGAYRPKVGSAERRLLASIRRNAARQWHRLASQLAARRQAARLRDNFRQYLDSRLDFYRNLPRDTAAATKRAAALQAEIWNQAVEATLQIGTEANANAVTPLVMQSINDVIDIATTRMVSLSSAGARTGCWWSSC